jgi:transposase-like protein
MDAHENARTTPHSRMLIVARLAMGQSVAVVASSLGVTPRTVRKWRDRRGVSGIPCASGWLNDTVKPGLW